MKPMQRFIGLDFAHKALLKIKYSAVLISPASQRSWNWLLHPRPLQVRSNRIDADVCYRLD